MSKSRLPKIGEKVYIRGEGYLLRVRPSAEQKQQMREEGTHIVLRNVLGIMWMWERTRLLRSIQESGDNPSIEELVRDNHSRLVRHKMRERFMVN